jgi:hypothetical protein
MSAATLLLVRDRVWLAAGRHASTYTGCFAGTYPSNRERLLLEEEALVARPLPPIHPRDFRGATRIAECIKCKGTRLHRGCPCPRCHGLGVVRVPHPRYLMLRNSRDDLMAKARRALNPADGVVSPTARALAARYVAAARAFNRDLVKFLKSKYNRGVRR